LRAAFRADYDRLMLASLMFEHLRDPAAAAREPTRVLKPGGMAFICTPFMQAFHGHPNHCQNFTIAAHNAVRDSRPGNR
jgi:ubiquinone/menaquinone biosynthesis C-methylase UbiE